MNFYCFRCGKNFWRKHDLKRHLDRKFPCVVKYLDIEGKDIVIGMLQSLSMKKYPTSIFQYFGLTIVDETHHLAAEVFSNALFQIVTKYMLGLSATMQRKVDLPFL